MFSKFLWTLVIRLIKLVFTLFLRCLEYLHEKEGRSKAMYNKVKQSMYNKNFSIAKKSHFKRKALPLASFKSEGFGNLNSNGLSISPFPILTADLHLKAERGYLTSNLTMIDHVLWSLIIMFVCFRIFISRQVCCKQWTSE